MTLFNPLNFQMGAELLGADLAKSSDAGLIADIIATLRERRMVVARGQTLSPEQQVALMRRFGELETHPVHPGQPLDLPEIFRVANDPVEGFTNVGRYWHTDGGARNKPTRFVSLYGVDVSEEDGRTDFLDMKTAYQRLPETLKAQIADRVTRRVSTGVRQPLVRAHPETGAPMLFLPMRIPSHHVPDPKALSSSHPLFNKGPEGWGVIVEGLEEEASDSLLSALTAHVASLGNTSVTHRWRPGDFVIWDNAALYHHAFPSAHPRILNRVSVKGDKASLFNMNTAMETSNGTQKIA